MFLWIHVATRFVNEKLLLVKEILEKSKRCRVVRALDLLAEMCTGKSQYTPYRFSAVLHFNLCI